MGGSVLVALLLSIPLRATMVLPLTLDQIAARADKIFVGRCESVSIDLDENRIPVTYVTYEVLQGIKGDVRRYETVKLIGVPKGGSPKGAVLADDGLLASRQRSDSVTSPNEFSVGEEEILFLYRESRWGFTSPVGYGQGRFRIQTLSDGGQIVTNCFQSWVMKDQGTPPETMALRFKESKKTKSVLPIVGGPFELQEFLSVVEEIVAGESR